MSDLRERVAAYIALGPQKPTHDWVDYMTALIRAERAAVWEEAAKIVTCFHDLDLLRARAEEERRGSLQPDTPETP